MEPSIQQVKIWNKWRKHWFQSIRPLTKQLLAISEYSAKLQTLLNDLNYSANVWDDSKTEEVKTLIDVFNRIERSISKVDIQSYGLQFHENNTDFDIMAPPGYPGDEYDNDVVNFGLVFVLIGIGMIVVGAALKVSEHLERRENIRLNEQKLEIAKVMQETGAAAPEIKTAIDTFNTENKSLIKEAGLMSSIFGESSVMMITAALGIGFLMFVYLKGKK